nr:hypothetical protein [uncultured Bdellovibrio sp.]
MRRIFFTFLLVIFQLGCSLDLSLKNSQGSGDNNSETPDTITAPLWKKPSLQLNGTPFARLSLPDGRTLVGGSFNSAQIGDGACHLYSFSSSEQYFPCLDVFEPFRTMEQSPDGGFYFSYNRYYPDSERLVGKLNPDGTVGSWNPLFEKTFPFDLHVNSMRVHNGVLYVGGNFEKVNGQTRSGLAAFDIATGDLLDWNPGLLSDGNNDIEAKQIEIYNDKLYVLGYHNGGGQNALPRQGIVVLNLNDNNADPTFDFAFSSTMYSVGKMRFYKDLIFIALYDFNSVEEFFIASAATGARHAWSPSTMTNDGGWIFNFELQGDQLWFVGDFTTFNGLNRKYIARLDISNISENSPPTLNNWTTAVNFDSEVYDITVGTNTVIVTGDFHYADDQNADGIAALKKSDGTLLGLDLGHPIQDASDANTISHLGNDQFLFWGHLKNEYWSRDNLIMFEADGSVSEWNASVDRTVTDLTTDGTKIYIAGFFRTVNGSSQEYLAALNPLDGTSLSWSAGADGPVTALKYKDGELIVGGGFSNIGATPVSRRSLAKLNALTGEALSWNPSLIAANYPWVNSLEILNDKVVVGGSSLATAAHTTRENLIAVDTNTGALQNWFPKPNDQVRDIVIQDNDIYISGGFSQVGPSATPKAMIAKLNLSSEEPQNWTPPFINEQYIFVSTLWIENSKLLAFKAGEMKIFHLDLTSGAETNGTYPFTPTMPLEL